MTWAELQEGVIIRSAAHPEWGTWRVRSDGGGQRTAVSERCSVAITDPDDWRLVSREACVIRRVDSKRELSWCVILRSDPGWLVEWFETLTEAAERLRDLSSDDDAPRAYVCCALSTNARKR